MQALLVRVVGYAVELRWPRLLPRRCVSVLVVLPESEGSVVQVLHLFDAPIKNPVACGAAADIAFTVSTHTMYSSFIRNRSPGVKFG